MKNREWMTEEIDRRVLYLRMRKKLLLLPLFLAAGMLICGLLYQGYRMAVKEPCYQQVSKLYIDFAKDDKGKPADYYNGATWTDLLTAHPGIWDKAEGRLSEALPELAGTEGALKDFVRKTVSAEILSDVRLMTVTVTTAEPSLTGKITEIMDDALVSFGAEAKEFERISFLSADPVRQTVLDSRMRNALLLGAFLGLLSGLFILWLRAILDDGVYTPEEAQKRYGLPVLGMTFRALRDGKDPGDGKFSEETRDNLALFFNGQDAAARLVSPLGKEKAEAFLASLSAQPDPALKGAAARFQAFPENDYDALRGGPVCLALPYGLSCAAAADHLISQLSKQGCPVRALFLQDADPAFIRRYYEYKGI